MKRTIIFSLLAALCGGLQAQTLSVKDDAAIDTVGTSMFTAVYRYEIQTQDAKGNATTDSILLALQVGDGQSKWFAYDRYLKEKGEQNNVNDCAYMEALMHVQSVWSGYPSEQRRTLEAIAPYCYETTEKRQQPAWTLTEETDSVCGYLCRGASGEFRGKTWHVLYAEEIPSPVGPWKLEGLPGLIAKAEDAEHHHRFTLVGITQEARPITYPKYYSLFAYDGGGASKKAVPYMKKTLSEMVAFKQRVFGSKSYPMNPNAYMPDLMTAFGSVSTVYGQTQDVRVVNGTVILGEAHVYQPLER